MKITARILIVVLTAGSAACTTTQQRVGGSSRWMAFLALSTPGQREPLQVLGLELLLRLRSSGETIYPRTADLTILSRCEVAALDQDEAVLMAKDRVDGVISL